MTFDQRVTPPLLPLADYNSEHFPTKHFLADLRTTLRGGGVRPGEAAPDFDLEATGLCSSSSWRRLAPRP